MAVIRDKMPAFQLFQPASTEEALGVLDQYGADAWVLAGGLDTWDWLKDRVKKPAAVVDLGGISELSEIRSLGGGLEIGAMATLRDAERELADERFQAVFVSVDPERDTREAIGAYLAAFSPRFVGVTGQEHELRRFGLELAAGFMRTPAPDGVPADRYLVDHSGHVAIVDPEGRFVAILKDPRRGEYVVEAFRTLAGRA